LTYKIAATALPLLLAGSFVSAQELNYLSYGGSYTSLDTPVGDVDLFSLGASIDYTNNGFLFNGGVGYIDLDGDVDLTNLNFRAGYFVAPGAIVYAGIDYSDADGESLTAYNIGGEYGFGAFTVGLNFFEADIDDADTFTTLYGSYQATDELEVALFIEDGNDLTTVSVGADFEMEDTDVNAVYSDTEGFGVFAVSGTYDFGNSFRVGGSYANFDGDVNLFTVSGGYEVADRLWVDASFGQIDPDFGGSADTIGLALSYETGRETLLIDRAQTAQTQAFGLIGDVLGNGGF